MECDNRDNGLIRNWPKAESRLSSGVGEKSELVIIALDASYRLTR